MNSSLFLFSKGRDVPFWDNLCYFTYFIIHSKKFPIYDSFLNQFQSFQCESIENLSREMLKMFFQLCDKYYQMIKSIVENELEALKILIRMLSVVPISEENMAISIIDVQIFVSALFQIVLIHFEELLTSVRDNEWSSFCQGLIHLFAIQLYYQNANKQIINPIVLLSKMSDSDSRKEEMTVGLVDLLVSLCVSLPVDQSKDLIESIDENYLTLQHLELASSWDIYINFLTRFVICHMEIDDELKENIDTHLDDILNRNRFPSKNQMLNSLDFLISVFQWNSKTFFRS